MPDWDGVEVEFTVVTRMRFNVSAADYGDARTLEEAMEIDSINYRHDPIGMIVLEAGFSPETVNFEVNWRKLDGSSNPDV